MPFDEAIFLPWARIRAALPQFPVPFDSVAVTVELRVRAMSITGWPDRTARPSCNYLTACGVICRAAGGRAALPHPATLSGSETLIAPHAGLS
jgi:hypothetical protein